MKMRYTIDVEMNNYPEDNYAKYFDTIVEMVADDPRNLLLAYGTMFHKPVTERYEILEEDGSVVLKRVVDHLNPEPSVSGD